MTVRVVVQERQRFMREGLAMVLGREPHLDVIATAETHADVTRLCDEQQPHLVLLELDGLQDVGDVAGALRKRHRDLRIVGLAASASGTLHEQARASGVETIVPKPAGIKAVLQSLRPENGGTGNASAPEIDERRTVKASTGDALTPREIEVLRLVAAGHTTKEISSVLSISPKTVENHKQRTFIKLGVHNQAHAVSIALRGGFLDPVPSSEDRS